MSATLLALLLLADPQVAPTPLEFIDAKRLADADEASVTGAAHDAMRKAQAAMLEAGVGECARLQPQQDFSAFTVVMRLDAQGHVQQTWRQGSSPLAICLQRYVRGKTLSFAPPKAPFHASLEITFTK